MKRFFFSLQTLLDYRKRKEEELKKKLAAKVAEEERERQILRKLERKVTLCQENLRKKERKEKIELAIMLLYNSYLKRLEEQIEEQKKRIEKISQEKKTLHQEFLQASKARKIVEKMREKRWTKYVYHQRKLEQDLIDESAIAKFYKKT